MTVTFCHFEKRSDLILILAMEWNDPQRGRQRHSWPIAVRAQMPATSQRWCLAWEPAYMISLFSASSSAIFYDIRKA